LVCRTIKRFKETNTTDYRPKYDLSGQKGLPKAENPPTAESAVDSEKVAVKHKIAIEA